MTGTVAQSVERPPSDREVVGSIQSRVIPDFIKKKVFITKTCLYNFDPLKPHFYMVKLGFTGV